jgi:hypothetical protein
MGAQFLCHSELPLDVHPMGCPRRDYSKMLALHIAILIGGMELKLLTGSCLKPL